MQVQVPDQQQQQQQLLAFELQHQQQQQQTHPPPQSPPPQVMYTCSYCHTKFYVDKEPLHCLCCGYITCHWCTLSNTTNHRNFCLCGIALGGWLPVDLHFPKSMMTTTTTTEGLEPILAGDADYSTSKLQDDWFSEFLKEDD
jgi:hypothetical protein